MTNPGLSGGRAMLELAEQLTPVQRALVLASDDEDGWLSAFLLGHLSGYKFTNGGTVRAYFPYGLFESKMGGAQCNVYRLTDDGKKVAAALRARAADTPSVKP